VEAAREEGGVLMECECPETSVLRAKGVAVPALHSCDYVRKRNVIAHQALEDARKQIKRQDTDTFGAFDDRVRARALILINERCALALRAGDL
jgi:hypothetical protein